MGPGIDKDTKSFFVYIFVVAGNCRDCEGDSLYLCFPLYVLSIARIDTFESYLLYCKVLPYIMSAIACLFI